MASLTPTQPPQATTLLDTVLDGLVTAGRPLLTITRMCLIGKLSDGSSASAFAAWCDNYCRPPAEITGLLLQLDGGWIMTVEGPTNDLLPFLRAMHTDLSPGGSLVTVKLVSQQEDVRSRFFPIWASHKASVIRSNYAEVEGEAMLTALLAETAISMLKIGKLLSKNGASLSALDSWESHKDLADMPSNERVAQLLDFAELTPLDAFMKIFETPVDIMLESDRTWPPPYPHPY